MDYIEPLEVVNNAAQAGPSNDVAPPMVAWEMMFDAGTVLLQFYFTYFAFQEILPTIRSSSRRRRQLETSAAQED